MDDKQKIEVGGQAVRSVAEKYGYARYLTDEVQKELAMAVLYYTGSIDPTMNPDHERLVAEAKALEGK